MFLVQGSASVGQVLDIVLELSEQERCAVVRGIADVRFQPRLVVEELVQ